MPKRLSNKTLSVNHYKSLCRVGKYKVFSCPGYRGSARISGQMAKDLAPILQFEVEKLEHYYQISGQMAKVPRFGSDFYNLSRGELEHHYELTLRGKSAPNWLRILQFEEGKSEHHYECGDLYSNNKEDFYCLPFSWLSVSR